MISRKLLNIPFAVKTWQNKEEQYLTKGTLCLIGFVLLHLAVKATP